MFKSYKRRLLILIIIMLMTLITSFKHESYRTNSSRENENFENDSLESANINPDWTYFYGGEYVRGIAISSDGNYIAGGGTDWETKLFHKSSSTPIRSYTTNHLRSKSIDISSDGNYIVAGAGSSVSSKVFLLERSSSTPLWSYETNHFVSTIAISADGNYIVAGSEDYYTYFFQKSSSTPLWTYNTGGIVCSVAISSNGEYIVSGGQDSKVCLFQKSSSTPIWSYSVSDRISSVSISSDGNYIVAGSFDNNLYLFHKSSSTPLWIFNGANLMYSVVISSDGNYIVAGCYDYNVYLFHRSTSTPLWSYNTGYTVRSVAISDDGNFIVAGAAVAYSTGVGLIHLFHKSSSTPLRSYDTGYDIDQVDISSDGSNFVAASGYYFYYFKEDYFPKSFSLSTDADIPDTDGSFNLIWTDSAGADNYSVYVHDSYISEINGSLTLLADQTASSPYPITENSGIYYYVIVAYNETGFTLSNCISVDIQIPPGPFSLSTDADIPDTDGSFNLIWTDSAGADNYSVYVHDSYISEINGSLTLLADQTANSPYLISGVTNGTYFYAVVAFNPFGNITSDCISIEVKLFPPGSFTLSSDAGIPDTDGSFNLIWTDSAGADNYSVYVHDSYITEFNDSLTLLTDQTANSPYLISGLSNGTYYYIVEAYNLTGSRLSNCISIDIKLFPPGSFTLSTDADTPDLNGIFNLIWTDSTYADNYSVYVHDSYITEINGSLTLLADQTVNSPYLVSGLNNGTYFYTVIAFNPFGNTTSNCISIEVKLFPPGSFTLSTDADAPDPDGSFMLIWTDSAGADNYSVYVHDSYISEINGSLTLLADQIASSPYPITENSGIYYYVVIAYNETGYTLSNCICIEIQIPPGLFSLTTDADAPDPDGSFNLTWTDSMYANNYSVYVHDSYISEINGSLTLLADQTASSPYPITENSGTYFYIVVAFNEYGMIVSNCIKIEVNLPSDQLNIIPGYNIFLLIGTISIVLLILKRKQKQ